MGYYDDDVVGLEVFLGLEGVLLMIVVVVVGVFWFWFEIVFFVRVLVL